MWVDSDRWYFIFTTSSLTDGNPYSLWQWRQSELSREDMGLPNNRDAVRQDLTVPQPKACEIYYVVQLTSIIDTHGMDVLFSLFDVLDLREK